MSLPSEQASILRADPRGSRSCARSWSRRWSFGTGTWTRSSGLRPPDRSSRKDSGSAPKGGQGPARCPARPTGLVRGVTRRGATSHATDAGTTLPRPERTSRIDSARPLSAALAASERVPRPGRARPRRKLASPEAAQGVPMESDDAIRPPRRQVWRRDATPARRRDRARDVRGRALECVRLRLGHRGDHKSDAVRIAVDQLVTNGENVAVVEAATAGSRRSRNSAWRGRRHRPARVDGSSGPTNAPRLDGSRPCSATSTSPDGPDPIPTREAAP